MKSYQVFIFTTLLFFTLLLGWVGLKRYDDFVEYHNQVSMQSTSGIADEFSRIIAEKQRLVKIFAHENYPLLLSIIRNPEDTDLQLIIENKLKESFPYYFTFTLADASGIPYLDDFEGNLNELCEIDIKQFAETNIHLPRIHPNPNAYHFDIMAFIPQSRKRQIIFVSFKAELLSTILSHSQPPAHNLILVYDNKRPLIEITTRGPRNKIDRHDYHLTDKELLRLVYKRKIEGTQWEVIDLHAPDLFTNFIWTLITQSLLMFIPFLVFALIMRHLFIKEERLRRKAETTRDEFMSTVSHELRTPLTAIQGALGLIANGIAGEISPKTTELVNIAMKNSKRLVLLVNDLLDMRKLEMGKMDYKMVLLDITSLIKTALEENQNYARQFNNSFVFEAPDKPVYVKGDENRILQVMANLLSNAAKYGRANDSIVIDLTERDGMIRTSVSDNGPGIPSSYQNKIFEKFIRVNDSDTNAVGGSGLGLSIVKTIIEDHGGSVGFQSSIGKGTTFYFDLPTQI